MNTGQNKIFASICDANNIPKPVCEYKFRPDRKWRCDYAWPDHKIILEVEGGIWKKGGGAHSRPSNIIRDIEKYNAATLMGFRVLRVTPENLFKQETIEMIKKLLKPNHHGNNNK